MKQWGFDGVMPSMTARPGSVVPDGARRLPGGGGTRSAPGGGGTRIRNLPGGGGTRIVELPGGGRTRDL